MSIKQIESTFVFCCIAVAHPEGNPLQRVSKKAMKTLDSKDIITVFPDQGIHNRTALVLKTPKTPTSIRKVFLPKTVAEMLVAWKMEQDAAIEAIGNEYADFNLVIATPVP